MAENEKKQKSMAEISQTAAESAEEPKQKRTYTKRKGKGELSPEKSADLERIKARRENTSARFVKSRFVLYRNLLRFAGAPEEMRNQFRPTDSEIEELKQAQSDLLEFYGVKLDSALALWIAFGLAEVEVANNCLERAGISIFGAGDLQDKDDENANQ